MKALNCNRLLKIEDLIYISVYNYLTLYHKRKRLMRHFLEEVIAIKLAETESVHQQKLKASELYFLVLIRALNCKSIFCNTKQVAPLRGGHNLSSMYQAIKSIIELGKIELVRSGKRFVAGAISAYHVSYQGDKTIEKVVETKNEIKEKLLKIRKYDSLLNLEFRVRTKV